MDDASARRWAPGWYWHLVDGEQPEVVCVENGQAWQAGSDVGLTLPGGEFRAWEPSCRGQLVGPIAPPAADLVQLVDMLVQWAQSAALAPYQGGAGDEAASQAELDGARAQLLAALGVVVPQESQQ